MTIFQDICGCFKYILHLSIPRNRVCLTGWLHCVALLYWVLRESKWFLQSCVEVNLGAKALELRLCTDI